VLDGQRKSKIDGTTDQLGKSYYCPLKTNRLADDTGGAEKKYKRIEHQWSEPGATTR